MQEQSISGKRWEMQENPMGIRWISLSFGETDGILRYENSRGTKEILSAIVRASTMKGGVTMYIEFPYTLFFDPQAAMPAEFCIRCGCECYRPGLFCLRCHRRAL